MPSFDTPLKKMILLAKNEIPGGRISTWRREGVYETTLFGSGVYTRLWEGRVNEGVTDDIAKEKHQEMVKANA